MTERRRLLFRGFLVPGIATVLVVWLAVGGSSAPAAASHRGDLAWSTVDASYPQSSTWASPRGSSGSGTASPTTSSTTNSTTSVASFTSVPAQTFVATIPWSGAPGSKVAGGPRTRWVPGHWLGAHSVLPVIGIQPGWYHLRLAQRPNESTAWVRSRYIVKLATDPYRIVIDLGATHLRLYKAGRRIGNFPVGVGLPAYPTPRGHFFVALFARAPSSAWGAFVIITSAHSNTITDWDNTGDGITGIHGPLGADAQIGTTGARVSHGCVRMHKAQLLHLKWVPQGTPIDIHG